MRKIDKGQSLFEVILAISISAIILIAIVSLSVRSVSTSSFARNNTLATEYAQEGIEWLREQRDADWTNLIEKTDANFGEKSFSSSAAEIPDTIFERFLTIELTDEFPQFVPDGVDDTARVKVAVSWEDSSGYHDVVLNSILTKWIN